MFSHSFTLSQIKSNLSFTWKLVIGLFPYFLKLSTRCTLNEGAFPPHLSIGEVEIRVKQYLNLLKECQVSKEVKSLLFKNPQSVFCKDLL